jgi:DNA-binding GntR family transcriptional regulator
MDTATPTTVATPGLPAREPSAAERVYRHVRSAILDRRYADNELLAEGRIAEETGVSRTPVREALLRLEAEGMIRLLPKRGALVLPVSVQEWRDVLATRALVEAHSATAVIAAGRGPVLAEVLDVHLGRLCAAAETDDVTGYVAADRDFHAAIVAAAGNAILTKLYGTLRDRQLRMGATNLLSADGAPLRARMAATAAEHRAIAEAIRAGDADLAEELTRDHLAHADRTLREN